MSAALLSGFAWVHRSGLPASSHSVDPSASQTTLNPALEWLLVKATLEGNGTLLLEGVDEHSAFSATFEVSKDFVQVLPMPQGTCSPLVAPCAGTLAFLRGHNVEIVTRSVATSGSSQKAPTAPRVMPTQRSGDSSILGAAIDNSDDWSDAAPPPSLRRVETMTPVWERLLLRIPTYSQLVDWVDTLQAVIHQGESQVHKAQVELRQRRPLAYQLPA